MDCKTIGYYIVYENGDIISLKGSPKKIKCRADKAGYLHTCLRIDKQYQYWLLHRLLATLFIPNPENKPWVDHINGDKTDNSISNLRWVTALENRNNPNTTNNCNRHFRAKNVEQVGDKRIYTYQGKKYLYKSVYTLKENLNVDL